MPDPAYLFGPARPRRPCIMAQRHVVVSGHYYASLAGLQILEAGGNAIDAGVATGLAIDVLESQFVGFGGVAPIMVYLADRDAGAGDQRRRPMAAGRRHRAFPSRLRRPHPRRLAAHRGAGGAGQLDRGAGALGHDAVFATSPPRRSVSRATGFRPIRSSSKSSRTSGTRFEKFPTTAAIFLPGGRVPEVGRKLRPGRSGAVAAIHGGPGAGGARRPAGRARRGA